ncbi:MAG TPA: nucleoside phosphorylase [Desulfopila sp.]|nr:nucleoside phosphorylase [Desulfopila sp.]
MTAPEDDCIIHPRKSRREREIPPTGILCVNASEAKEAVSIILEAGGERRTLHNSHLVVTVDGGRFVAGPALGAPAAALVLEKLIVLGARRIFFLGWCGAVCSTLSIGNILVPTSAVSGEGTSAYYTDSSKPEPSSALSSTVGEVLGSLELTWRKGTVWSTDAPYREKRKYLQMLHRIDQVVAVDMEFSALCSVAAFRKVDFAGAMIVSDELWRTNWRPGFKDEVFKKHCRQVLKGFLEKEL